MRLRDIKKWDYIVNAKIPGCKPWLVLYKSTGMVVVRRGPKIGKITGITSRQLCDFVKCGRYSL
jgi:hypothetical protein